MTGQIYFDMLNEVEQSQFISNFVNCRLENDDFKDFLREEFDDFDTFVSSSFLFAKTPEGADYWREIRDSQRDGVDASARREGNSKSMEELISKLLLMALLSDDDESKSDEPSESLDDVLSALKIKLSDD